MNNHERVRNLVNTYVAEHGSGTEMTRSEFLEWVHETYENISAQKNNLYPTDLSYNLYNEGLVDFPGPNLCLVYVEERGTFKFVGTGYKHTGPIWQYKGKKNERIVGQWIDGVCKMGDSEEKILTEELLLRRKDITEWIPKVLKGVPIDVSENARDIMLKFREKLICGVTIEDEGYKIYNVSAEWADNTSYLCTEESDGTWSYYVETADEILGEVKNLFLFEAKKRNAIDSVSAANSELRQMVTLERFENAYKQFIEQADENAKTGKGRGPRTPFGFSVNYLDGGNFTQHFGQGGASKTPYINWHVVSIYYLPDTGNIIMGIETDRFIYLNQMKPLRNAKIGNKKTDVAVFYEATKDNVDYKELHDRFLSVSEEVMRKDKALQYES